MELIGGLQALRTKMLQETCCITGKAVEDGRPAIVRIKRRDGRVMTVNGKVSKGVRKGSRYYLGGKVLSCIRKDVVMTIERNKRGKTYAACSKESTRIPRRTENLSHLSGVPAHIRKNILAKRDELDKVWG